MAYPYDLDYEAEAKERARKEQPVQQEKQTTKGINSKS